MAASNMPVFNVYTVEDRGQGEDPFWLKIGAAFSHKDGKGFNLVLSAFPIDNRLVMRIPAENGEDGDKKPEPQSKSRRKR
ncbi:MAG: hypothetical protein L3J67_07145 [Hyphomicrobiaceae bacterium]|nr:hypothetical protein [Hyphomicrobiaceae bacterium]